MSTTNLSVQWWPTTRPVCYARNARVCPEAAIAKVAGSIHEFGFKNPILVDAEGVIIAAENTGRVCCAMEQSPAFVDAAVTRWEAYVGETATLESDGRSFADVAAERLP